MAAASSKKKVLLMGKSGSGKTSMRSIIFANYIARDTMRLGATIDVEHSHVRFLGDLVLNLWDCGGQEAFMENYLSSQREHIFRNVHVLIYIFDVESREVSKDFMYYRSCIEAILATSPSAQVFCLVHKMDLVPEEHREATFLRRAEEIQRETEAIQAQYYAALAPAAAAGVSATAAAGPAAAAVVATGAGAGTGGAGAAAQAAQTLSAGGASALSELGSGSGAVASGAGGAGAGGGAVASGAGAPGAPAQPRLRVRCFRTSIWDETLYRAWSSIVYSLIPNVDVLERHLHRFGEICEADEVVLFERATFLVISYHASLPHRDDHRFEKISNIIKQFKLSCSSTQGAQFLSMEVRNSNFSAFIDQFTANTYVMVIMSDPAITSAATLINIKNARAHFEKFVQSSSNVL